MEIFTLLAALIIAVTFIGFIVYCAKGGNLLVGLFVTATI